MPEIVAKLDSQMWPFAALLVGSCFLQVILFVRNVLSFNKKTKLLSQEEIKSAVKVGAVATLGPHRSGDCYSCSNGNCGYLYALCCNWRRFL